MRRSRYNHRSSRILRFVQSAANQQLIPVLVAASNCWIASFPVLIALVQHPLPMAKAYDGNKTILVSIAKIRSERELAPNPPRE